MLALAWMLAVTPIVPTQETMTQDMRCLVVSLVVAANPDFQAVGVASSFYWIGRVNGLLSEADLEDAITREYLRMTPADIRIEAGRCGAEMGVLGKAMERIGAGLVRRGERLETR